MKKLIKSYNFWTGLAGAVGLLFVVIAKLFGKEIESKTIEDLIMAICGVLVVCGIVIKPKTNTKQIEQVDINVTKTEEINENQNNEQPNDKMQEK